MSKKRKLVGLSADGNLTLRLADGSSKPINAGPLSSASAFILLDCSGSMAGRKLENAKEGVKKFIGQALSKKYEVGIVSFETEAQLISPLLGNEADLCGSVDTIRDGGSTNMTSAITMAYQELISLQGNRAIIVATDGRPDDPESARAAANDAKQQGISIITIGTEDADRGFLASIATSNDLAVSVATQQIGTAIGNVAALLPAPTNQR